MANCRESVLNYFQFQRVQQKIEKVQKLAIMQTTEPHVLFRELEIFLVASGFNLGLRYEVINCQVVSVEGIKIKR